MSDFHHDWVFGRNGFLYRHGGYWWDGAAWHRPGQVVDRAYEGYDARPVEAAVTVTAADLLSEQPLGLVADHNRLTKIIRDSLEDADSPQRKGGLDGQLVDTGFFGEGGDGLQVCGFDRSVVTGRRLDADVVAVLIAVGRVVRGDPVDVWQHVTTRRRLKALLMGPGGVQGRGTPWRG